MSNEEVYPRFWSKCNPRWNFGDAISQFLFSHLLIDFTPYSKRPWTIGSVLLDGAPLIESDDDNAELPSFLNERNCEAVFWGCGLREPGSLSHEFARHVALLSVRGPLSASDLRLGAEIPIGDPALFLPALYAPRKREAFIGKAVCIPHYLDERSDQEILALTGCDVILRPAIKPNMDSLERLIDAICSADFVLCGALHGAITAAGYGVPFGYWDSGQIDAPFKWADFSALIGIPCDFQANLADAREHYASKVAASISIPSMWPLLCAAPTFVRPDGLLKVLKYELGRRGGPADAVLDELLGQMSEGTWQMEHLIALSRKVTNQIVPGLAAERDVLRQEAVLRGQEVARMSADLAEVRNDAAVLQAANVALDHQLDVSNIQIDNLHAGAALNEARFGAAAEQHSADIERSTMLVEAAQAVARDLEVRCMDLTLQLEGQSLARDSAVDALALIQQQYADLVAQGEQALSEAARREAEWQASFEVLAHEREAAENRLADALAHGEAEKARADTTLAALEAEKAHSHNIFAALHAEQNSRAGAIARSLAPVQGDLAAAEDRLNAAIGQIAQTVGSLRSNAWAPAALKKIPVIASYDADFRRQTDRIMSFLAQFPEFLLGMSGEGREGRVMAYLLGVTSNIADLPLIDRNLYYALHPDVAQAGVDPFLHYLDYGKAERRSPHPLIDYDYYTQRYPETAQFDISILEHYLLFGAAKLYDPCEMFSTSDYLERYADLRKTKYNPVLHYLRCPDCQPHASFDSHYYRLNNPDVVRSGANPLAHYLLWGRHEGRSGLPVAQPPVETPVHVAPVAARQPLVTTGRQQPLVVMLDAFYPQPDQDSGSLDQTNFVRIFQALGYEVAFASLLDFTPPQDARRALVDLGVTCITGDDYVNVEEFVFLHAERISAFFLSRFNCGGNWIERARTFCPHAQVIFNTVDLHHVREERKARLENDEVALEHASLTRAAELERIALADVTVVVSQVERDLLEDIAPAADVRVIPLIRQIRDRAFPSFEKREGIAFVGGFQHLPNVDAVITFLETIWPKILAKRPDMTFKVIGSYLPETLSQRSDPNVEWVGYVPELEPWLDSVKVTVAPLRYGAGAKGKVVSSLLSGVPVVASQVAAEGMGFADGTGVHVAHDADGFAERILALYDDQALWEQTSRRGFEAVRDAYSLERGIALVEQILPRLEKA